MAKAVRRALGLLLAWSMVLVAQPSAIAQPVASAQTSVPAGKTLSETERTALSDQIKEVMVKQEFYVHTTPQEKAFLHLDKPYYTKGDTIWYRAYTLLANSMVPDTLNGTLYVDLVQQDGKVLTSSPLYLDRGMASGHIAFRDSLVPGYYMIRAYTSWMRNFSDEPLYSALVPIYGETGEDKQTRWIYSRSVKSGEGSEDTLQLHLMLTDNNFNPWSFQPFKFDFRSRFIRALQDEMTTAADGTADISVEIPRDVRRDVAALRLLVRNDEGRNEKTDFSISLIRNDSLQIQFLPEGGHLVDGVCSRLAYKALDMGGMGLKVAGSVYASDRDTALVRFESSDLGMGAFYITPQPGVSYRAEVYAVRNGAAASPVFDFALPDPLPRGYVMEVSSVTRGDIQVFVKRKGIADEEMLGLAVRSGGRITAGKVLLMRQDSVMFTLPRAQFDSGVSQITLFDAAGMPCCERMLFINKYQPLRITAKFDKAEYRPREKVTLDIQVEDADGQPAEASLSVSVTDAGLVPDTSQTGASLLTHMLLTSDLRGKVEQPGEYFADTTLARKKALDLLMLTQGWRRYDLARALEDRPDYPWRFEFALRIPGVIRNITTGRPMADLRVIRATGTLAKNALKENRWLHEVRGWEYKLATQKNLTEVTGATEYHDGWKLREIDETSTDENGEFLFYSALQGEFMTMFSTQKIVGRKKRETVVDRRVDMLATYDTLPGVPFMRHLDLHPDDMKSFLAQQRAQLALHASVASEEQDLKILRDSITTYLLPAVEVTAPREAAENFARSLSRYQFDAQMVTMMMANTDNSVMIPSIGEMLYYLYPNKVTYSEEEGYKWEGRTILTFDLTPQNILPNNHDYASIDMIYVAEDPAARQKTYEELKQYTEYWESLFDLNQTTGEGVFNTVLVFYTRKQTVYPQPGIRRVWWKGYLQPAEFYSPDYAHYDRNNIYDVAETEYDARSTIYWNPSVVTDQTGHAQVTFYKSDRYSPMQLNIQGMTAAGELGALKQ